MNSLGYFLLNYLDDLHGCETEDQVWHSFEMLIRLMRDLGRDIAHDKTTKPTQIIEVLGVWFDVVKKIIAISPDRLSEILSLLEVWRFKSHATKNEMQSLIGKLQFIAKCVRPGRIFILRLLNWMKSMTDFEYRRLDDHARMDIKWWYELLPQFSGESVLWHLQVEHIDSEISSDSCLDACGAHTEQFYFHAQFPASVMDETSHISQREILTIAVSLKMFGHLIYGKKIIFWCDNQASVECINNGRAHDTYMQKVLREIAYLSTKGNFWIRARFLDTKSNRPADILSRWEKIDNPLQQFLESLDRESMIELIVDDSLFQFSNNW